VVAGEDEDLILDCFRLANFFHISPEIFLAMPLSEVWLYLHWTIKLKQRMDDEASRRNG
jgi:hypothetical protein